MVVLLTQRYEKLLRDLVIKISHATFLHALALGQVRCYLKFYLILSIMIKGLQR